MLRDLLLVAEVLLDKLAQTVFKEGLGLHVLIVLWKEAFLLSRGLPGNNQEVLNNLQFRHRSLVDLMRHFVYQVGIEIQSLHLVLDTLQSVVVRVA